MTSLLELGKRLREKSWKEMTPEEREEFEDHPRVKAMIDYAVQRFMDTRQISVGDPNLDAHIERIVRRKDRLLGALRAEVPASEAFDEDRAWLQLMSCALMASLSFAESYAFFGKTWKRGRGQPARELHQAYAVPQLALIYTQHTGKPALQPGGVEVDKHGYEGGRWSRKADRGFPKLVTEFVAATGRKRPSGEGVAKIIRQAQRAVQKFPARLPELPPK